MARLTRTQKFAALREELANSSEESHINDDLNKFQDKLNSLESAFNKETETKKEDFNLNVDPIPSFEEVKQEATLEEVKPQEIDKTSEELENNFLKDFDFDNITKAIDEIVKQNVANLDDNQDAKIEQEEAPLTSSIFNQTPSFVNPGLEYVKEPIEETPEFTKEDETLKQEESEPEVAEIEEEQVVEKSETPTAETIEEVQTEDKEPEAQTQEEVINAPNTQEEVTFDTLETKEETVNEEINDSKFDNQQEVVEEPHQEVEVSNEIEENKDSSADEDSQAPTLEVNETVEPSNEEDTSEVVQEETNEVFEEPKNEDNGLDEINLDLSDLCIPSLQEDNVQETVSEQEVPATENEDTQEATNVEQEEQVEENTQEVEQPIRGDLNLEEEKEKLNFVEKDYVQLAADLAKEVEELDGKVEPVKEEPSEEVEEPVEETVTELKVEEAVSEEETLADEEVKEAKEETVLSNSDISSLLDSALAEVESYNNQAGRATVDQISNDLIEEVRHGNTDSEDEDDEFSNTVTLEIDKVLSEINMDTISSLKIDDVLEEKKEVEPLEVKPEDVAEKLADTIAHPVLAKSLEEEPVEIKSIEETFTKDMNTSTIAFDNKKLEKEEAIEEDYYYDDDKPNKILNVILIILMIMLVAIIGVIVYYILYARGIIG